MGFWADELAKCKAAMAAKTVDNYLLASVENSRQMRTTYAIFGNIERWVEYLEMKAAEEASSVSHGSIFMTVGGN